MSRRSAGWHHLLARSTTENMTYTPMRKQIVLLIIGGVLSLLILMFFRPPVARVEPETPGIENSKQPIVAGLFPATIDLGYVEPKSVHRFSLELVNSEDHDQPIIAVETNCVCIAATESPESIPAKDKMPITFEFTAPDLTGPYVKTISVTAGNKTWETSMRARIAAPLDTEPDILTFSLKNGNKEQPLTIRNDGPTPVRLLYATAQPPICTAKIGAEPIPPGGDVVLSVILLESQTSPTAILQINTNHRHQKTLRVSIQVGE